MNEQQWHKCINPAPMLDFLHGKMSDRKLRLFAVACWRNVRHLIEEDKDEVERLLAMAECFADGEATEPELLSAYRGDHYLGDDQPPAAITACDPTVSDAVRSSSQIAADFARGAWLRRNPGYRWRSKEARQAKRAELDRQISLLHCIFGNPFRPVTLDPSWVTRTVTAMAQLIYQEYHFSEMPILADALEEAGCDNRDILEHGQSAALHAKGCWLTDMLLGRS